MSRLGTVLGWIYTGLVLAFLLLPVVLLVPASLTPSEFLEFPPTGLTFDWYAKVFSSRAWMRSATLSLGVALASAVLSTILAIMLGIAQIRTGEIAPWQRSVLLSPLLLPHVILATGLFIFALEVGVIGETWLLILVNTAVALPIVATLMLAAFETIDPLIWTAAASLGARSLKILRSIIGPILIVSITVAFVMAFHSAWDETTFAVFIGPQRVPTLPGRMYSYLLQNVTPEIAAVAAVLLALTLVGLAAVVLLNRKKSRLTVAANAEAA